MQAKDLRSKSKDELKKDLEGAIKDLEKFMGNVYKGKEKNLSKIRLLRKDIAKIKTVISEKNFLEESKNA